jgi:hypothetical protein
LTRPAAKRPPNGEHAPTERSWHVSDRKTLLMTSLLFPYQPTRPTRSLRSPGQRPPIGTPAANDATRDAHARRWKRPSAFVVTAMRRSSANAPPRAGASRWEVAMRTVGEQRELSFRTPASGAASSGVNLDPGSGRDRLPCVRRRFLGSCPGDIAVCSANLAVRLDRGDIGLRPYSR